MQDIVFNGISYREYQSTEEANAWGNKYFSDILDTNSKDYMSIFYYTGSMARKWNAVMRRHPPIWSGDFEESARSEFASDGEQIMRINAVYSVLLNHKLPEDIVLYRYTTKKNLKGLTSGTVKNGVIFSDKAFTSTTLVKDLLVDFAKQHSYNCLLKIYAPKGLNGAYVSLKNPLSKLNEQEVLLLPGVKFQIIKIHWFSRPMLIECKAFLE